jgi:CPA2 family monovalent cation:H+ antiporter-2
MEFEFLKSLVIIFGVSAFVVFVLGRLKIPSVAGFLIAGIILGPYSFEFIKDVHEMELLAEIGVILLMFTIGLEFSLKNFLTLRSQVLGGGFLQVSLTVGIIATLSYLFFQQGINKALFNGFLVSLSSTAIVMKMLFDGAEMNTPHGRMSVGILIF